MRLMTALGHERHGRRFRDPSADPRLPTSHCGATTDETCHKRRHCALTSSACNSMQRNVGIVGSIYEGLRWGYPPAPTLSCVLVSKSLASWRSCNCSSSRPLVRLTIRPRLTAGRSPISFVQRIRLYIRASAETCEGRCMRHRSTYRCRTTANRHVGNRIFVAGNELIVRKLPVEDVELALQLHRKTVDGVFDLHRSISIEMPEAAAICQNSQFSASVRLPRSFGRKVPNLSATASQRRG